MLNLWIRVDIQKIKRVANALQSNTVTAEGSYKVSGSQITFTNDILFNVNVDTRAVVNGTYNFKINGNTLTLVQVIYDYSASYDLTKQ